ncbi:MAG: hypothetical protein QOI61_1496 [Actinomycetota bacterium]|jgi:hypothetical protein
MLSVRLQVLIDEDRARRLDAEAARRGVSVATLVREGIDAVLPEGPTPEQRRAAIARIMAAPKIDVPDPDELKRIITEMYDNAVPDA